MRNHKYIDSDQISKSKELRSSLKKQISPRKQFATKQNNRQQISNNGEILPSLADLEKNYEDDDNANQVTTICDHNPPTGIQQAVIELPANSNEILSLEEISSVEVDSQDMNLNMSASTMKTNDFIVNSVCRDTVVVDDDLDLDYGPSGKQKIESSEINSNSNINDVSSQVTGDVTVGYDVDISKTGRFSPLPCSSSDNNIILQNDLRFDESLTSNNICQPIVNISTPIETISIDDDDDVLIVSDYDLTRESNQYIPPPIIINVEYEPHNLLEEVSINLCDASITENTNILNNPPRFPASIIEVPSRETDLIINRVLRPSDHENNNVNESGTVGDDYDYDPDRKVKLSEFLEMFPCRKGSQCQERVKYIDVLETFTQTDNALSSRKRKHNYNRTNFIRNIGDCPICFESLLSNSISSTICGHIFCTHCLKTSLSVSKKCPTCRKRLKKKDYHSLFLFK